MAKDIRYPPNLQIVLSRDNRIYPSDLASDSNQSTGLLGVPRELFSTPWKSFHNWEYLECLTGRNFSFKEFEDLGPSLKMFYADPVNCGYPKPKRLILTHRLTAHFEIVTGIFFNMPVSVNAGHASTYLGLCVWTT